MHRNRIKMICFTIGFTMTALLAGCSGKQDARTVELSEAKEGSVAEEKEEETEESIAGNAKANSMKEAASETSTEASDEEKKPAGPTTIIVVVNRSPVTLSGKPSYVFVDVFDKIDFDLTRPKGKNIVTSLNGKPAQYMETLHDGDVIDIYWSN